MAFELSFLEAAGVAPGELHCTLQATRLTLGEKATSLAAAKAATRNWNSTSRSRPATGTRTNLSRQQIDYAAIDAVVAWRIAEK